jgi:glycine/D-amino acid oxidase-like deaminating enzyme
LDDLVGHQLEFVGRDDGNIWITGLDNTKACLENVKGSLEPDYDAELRYLTYAKRFLVKSESAELRVIAKGRTYRPTIGRTLPIVVRVEPRRLCSTTAPNDKGTGFGVYAGQGGVFISSGHGKYSITLGLGSGRLMSQIIIGEPTDIDVSSLGLPSSGVNEIVFQ